MQIEMDLKERLQLNKLVAKKQQEFSRAGYFQVTPQEIWEYLLEYRWEKHPVATFERRQVDIQAVSCNEFFDYQRLKAQGKASQEFDWQNLQDLL